MSRKQNKGFFSNVKSRLLELFPRGIIGNRIRLPHLILAAAGLLLIYSFFSGATGFIHIAKLHIEKSRLEKENHELLVKLVDAEITAKRLQNDLKFIEYIARTRHYLSRSGEVIYRFKE